jgi:hypothetical protein
MFHWWLHYMKDSFCGRIFSKNQKDVLFNSYIVKCRSTKCNEWIKENTDCMACYVRKRAKTFDKTLPKVICETAVTCSICISDIDKKDRCVKLTCNHMFHTNCISKWVHAHMNCPYCRTVIVEENQPILYS